MSLFYDLMLIQKHAKHWHVSTAESLAYRLHSLTLLGACIQGDERFHRNENVPHIYAMIFQNISLIQIH